eukprot:scaffold230930_cov33-Tisochrysis_lutea.AAC.4
MSRSRHTCECMLASLLQTPSLRARAGHRHSGTHSSQLTSKGPGNSVLGVYSKLSMSSETQTCGIRPVHNSRPRKCTIHKVATSQDMSGIQQQL